MYTKSETQISFDFFLEGDFTAIFKKSQFLNNWHQFYKLVLKLPKDYIRHFYGHLIGAFGDGLLSPHSMYVIYRLFYKLPMLQLAPLSPILRLSRGERG